MMKKFCVLFTLAALVAAMATERTVDTNYVVSPRTVYVNRKQDNEKTAPSGHIGRGIRERQSNCGMVILSDGRFADDPNNLVFEIQIGNLKRVEFRACAGSQSLAWATYDANGNVCRLGPQAVVNNVSLLAPNAMPKHEIIFEPREKVFCYSVGKAIRGKMKIRYYAEGSFSIGETAK